MATLAVSNIFAPLTLIQATQANQNFDDVEAFVNTNMIQKDASVPFTAVPSGPASNPVSDNQFSRKAYVDSSYFSMISTAFSTAGAGAYADVTAWTTTASKGITTTANNATVTIPGIYHVDVRGEYPTSASGLRRAVVFRVNGANVFGQAQFVGTSNYSSGIGLNPSASAYIHLAAADVLTVQYSQDSGGAVAATFRWGVWRIPGTV